MITEFGEEVEMKEVFKKKKMRDVIWWSGKEYHRDKLSNVKFSRDAALLLMPANNQMTSICRRCNLWTICRILETLELPHHPAA